jgi:small subunit ribosomal protein S17
MAELKTKKTTKIAAKKSDTAQDASKAKLHRRTMTAVVVSDKMMKTRVVRVERQVKNAMYGKYIVETNKFKIHDEENRSKMGDLVMIVESRPLSREKRWALQKIIRTASGEVLTKG